MENDERYNKARAMRIKVLGKACIEKSEQEAKAAGSFKEPFLNFGTEFGWGVWTRPGLDLKTRSLCTVAILTGLGRLNELRTHLMGALRNGATREELQELLIHVGVYAGMPAANSAFTIAQEVLEEYNREVS